MHTLIERYHQLSPTTSRGENTGSLEGWVIFENQECLTARFTGCFTVVAKVPLVAFDPIGRRNSEMLVTD